MHPKSSKVYFSDNKASIAGTVLFGGKIHCDLFNNYTDDIKQENI